MHHRPLTLYIAASLDGYIARPDGDISWLSLVESPSEDYGYAKFIETVDTIVIGRITYDKVLSFGVPWPHAGRKCYVLSQTRTGGDKNVEFFGGDIGDLIAQIRRKPGLGIYCDGGAEVVHELIQRDLIDHYVISVIPVLLGAGIALFKPGRHQHALRLVRNTTYPSGLVQTTYERVRSE